MRVLLIGDSCTDVYVYGDVKRLNPEAPVPIIEPKREDITNGMAWNVYNNLTAFGLSVHTVSCACRGKVPNSCAWSAMIACTQP